MASANINRYRQAKNIACAALEQAPEARMVFIAVECRDDEALRREVTWLIEAAEDPTGDTLSGDLQAMTRQAVEEISLEVPLPRNYRLIRRLDEGGTGVVYLAERIDGDLRQQVALKLLHLTSVVDQSLARRFADERRILGTLNHPNIAHLIDGGLTTEGRPFLAMEYVDGERIDLWCDRHELSLRERIRLFLKVCAAVDYAHRHMVIHRDIKPANILVTSGGEPKLLDFGIARLLDEDGATTLTETGRRALTMAYASPEQIEGRALSTATDVYSLGVVLYQLVAGVRPFDHLESAHLLPGAIVSGDISPPSKPTRPTSPPPRRGDGLPNLVPGKHRIPSDIDAIALKTLRNEPLQRYVSVKELSEDLEHFLSSRPVHARRGHWLYYTRRFAWRHRWGVAATLVLATLLGTFMLEREAQLERIAWERDRARAVTEFMNDLFVNADSLPSRGNEVTVREMLDRGAQELSDREGISADLKGSMLLATGRAYNALRLGEQALPLLEQAQLLLAADIDIEEQVLIATELAAAYNYGGQAAASISAYEEAIRLLASAPGDHADEITLLEIHKLRNHANVLDIPLQDVITRLDEILTGLQARPAPPDELLLQVYLALTAAYVVQRAEEEALSVAEKAVAIAQHLYEPEDLRRLESRYAYATAMILRNPEQALSLYESLIEDYERLIGSGHTLANRIGNYGVALNNLGRSQEAIAAFERAAEVALQSVGRDHYIYRVLNSNLAYLYLDEGDVVRAESTILGILPSLAEQASIKQGIDTFYYAVALATLADASAQQDKLDEAEAYYARAAEAVTATDHHALPSTRTGILEGLARTRLELALYPKARETLDQLDAFNEAQELATGHPGLVRAATLRLKLLNAAGQHEAAFRLATQAHAAACDAGQSTDTVLEELRTTWFEAYDNLDYEETQAPLPECGAAIVGETPVK